MNFPISSSHYVGRFAPSPTGHLHSGSVVTALASWLDARSHKGCWYVRIEDVDVERCRSQYADSILQDLYRLGLYYDGEVMWQSQRFLRYEEILSSLKEKGLAYPCRCTRKSLHQFWANQAIENKINQALPYPGICRPPVKWTDMQKGAWRFYSASGQHDVILKRADGLWAYALAVVVDDADQKVTHVVRGHDLLESTHDQIALHQALGYSPPQYQHIALVYNEKGQKLSKQQGAQAIDTQSPEKAWQVLCCAAQHLGLFIEKDKNKVPVDKEEWRSRLINWTLQWSAMKKERENYY